MKNIPVLLFTLWLAAVMSMPYAAEAPSSYPPMFQAMGHISRLDIKGQTVVINDMSYRLTADAKVHTPSTKFATLSDLSEGMMVGVKFSSTGVGRPEVTEIWVLPPNGGSSFR